MSGRLGVGGLGISETPQMHVPAWTAASSIGKPFVRPTTGHTRVPQAPTCLLPPVMPCLPALQRSEPQRAAGVPGCHPDPGTAAGAVSVHCPAPRASRPPRPGQVCVVIVLLAWLRAFSRVSAAETALSPSSLEDTWQTPRPVSSGLASPLSWLGQMRD